MLDVAFNSAADQAGLLPGDLIITLDGEPVLSSVALAVRLGDARPASAVDLGLRRGDDDVNLRVTVASGHPVPESR